MKTDNQIKSKKARKKINSFMAKMEQATRIFMILNNQVYPTDNQMKEACASLIARMRVSDQITDDFLRRLLGCYCYCINVADRFTTNELLVTFYHDIGGLVNKDEWLLPRCHGYAEYYNENVLKYSATELINQIKAHSKK